MNSSLIRKTFFFILLLISTSHHAQTVLLSKNAHISVITCGTGNETYSLFGHTAIRIFDSENGIDEVYNYGAFDFSTPNFIAKFTKGDLQYFAVSHRYSDFIDQYNYEKRSVYEQELNIPNHLKQKLFDNLNKTLNSDERYYTYKFIDKNCTSMVVDIINKTLGSVTIVKKTDTDKTYRTILFPYFDNHFDLQLGTSIIFGKKVDQMGTRIFLPSELLESLKRTSFQNHPLVGETKTLLTFEKEVPVWSWWNNFYFYLLFLTIIVAVNKRAMDLFYFSVMGILGLFFVFIGFYSSHLELGYNYNVLLFSPTLLLLGYFYFIKNKNATYKLAIFNVFSLAVYLVIMLNKACLSIVFPLILCSLVILVKLMIKNRKQIPTII